LAAAPAELQIGADQGDEPRAWAAADWLANVVPHLADGRVTAAVYDRDS
jgi:hypothetical protein